MKARLDRELVRRGIVATRSQAESYIKLGSVQVTGKVVKKPGALVSEETNIKLSVKDQYVSRAALKLASVSDALKLDFMNKTVLDVGSSTGGFTEFALKHGAKKVIAVDVGSNQLHPSLRTNERIQLHEQTDIRNFAQKSRGNIDIVVIDVSFISLREILPSIIRLCGPATLVAAMVKPQFEAGKADTNKGVIKNDRIRREILRDFESWVQKYCVVIGKADSSVSGAKGNLERFYLLKKLS